MSSPSPRTRHALAEIACVYRDYWLPFDPFGTPAVVALAFTVVVDMMVKEERVPPYRQTECPLGFDNECHERFDDPGGIRWVSLHPCAFAPPIHAAHSTCRRQLTAAVCGAHRHALDLPFLRSLLAHRGEEGHLPDLQAAGQVY